MSNILPCTLACEAHVGEAYGILAHNLSVCVCIHIIVVYILFVTVCVCVGGWVGVPWCANPCHNTDGRHTHM